MIGNAVRARAPFWYAGVGVPLVVGIPTAKLATAEPPRPHDGWWFEASNQTLIPAQLIYTRKQLISAEPPRPHEGGTVILANRPLINAQLDYIKPSIVQSEAPRPHDGWWFEASNQNFVPTQAQTVPPLYAFGERPTFTDGLATAFSNQPLIPGQLTPPQPTITYATILPGEPPRPHEGWWYTSQNQPYNLLGIVPNQYITIAVSEAPRPSDGQAAIFEKFQFNPVEARPALPVLVQSEPPRPPEGLASYFTILILAAQQLHVNQPVPLIAAQSEPPRPYEGSAYKWSNESLAFQMVRPQIATSEPPRPYEGTSISLLGRALAQSQFGGSFAVQAVAESSQPETGRVIIRPLAAQATSPKWSISVIAAESPRPPEGSSQTFACRVPHVSEYISIPVRTAVSEPPRPFEGAAINLASHTVMPVPAGVRVIASGEPPRPGEGAVITENELRLILSQIPPAPPWYQPAEPPRPPEGAVLILDNRPLIAAQLIWVPPIIATAEPPRPSEGSIFSISSHSPSALRYPNPWISPSQPKQS